MTDIQSINSKRRLRRRHTYTSPLPAQVSDTAFSRLRSSTATVLNIALNLLIRRCVGLLVHLGLVLACRGLSLNLSLCLSLSLAVSPSLPLPLTHTYTQYTHSPSKHAFAPSLFLAIMVLRFHFVEVLHRTQTKKSRSPQATVGRLKTRANLNHRLEDNHTTPRISYASWLQQEKQPASQEKDKKKAVASTAATKPAGLSFV